MDTNTIEKLNASFMELLTIEPSPEAPAPAPAERPVQRALEAPPIAVARLPRSIAGGFVAVSTDLDTRARDWRNMSRLLNQQRPHLEAAEHAYSNSMEALNRLMPEVEESSRSLLDALKSTSDGGLSGDLSDRFADSLDTLEDLESVAASLMTNLVWVRSAWEQYAASILKGQAMRDQLPAGPAAR